MWKSLTAPSFRDKLLAQEYAALTAIGVQGGKTWDQVLADDLQRTASKVRGYCPAETPRGEGYTIPEELEDDALALVRQKFFSRFPQLQKLWTKDRADEYLQALELLKQWARGDYHVAPPSDPAPPEDQAAQQGAQLVVSLRRERARGL